MTRRTLKFAALTAIAIGIGAVGLYWLGVFEDPNQMHDVRGFKGLSREPLGRILAVGFTPDGESVIAGGNAGLWVWQTSNGKVVQHFAGPPRPRKDMRAINSFALSTDGTLLLTDTNSSTGAQLLRLADGSPLHEFETESTIASVTLSRDGRFAFAGSGIPFHTTGPIRPGAAYPIYQWDLDTRQLVRRFEGHSAAVTGLALLPGEKRLLSTSHDGTLRLWDLETGQELKRAGKDVGPTTSESTGGPILLIVEPKDRIPLALSHNGHNAVWGSKLWDIKQWNEVRKLGPAYAAILSIDDYVLSAAFSPDDRFLVTGHKTGQMRLWDVAARRELVNVRGFNDRRGDIYSIAFSPDGKYVLLGGDCFHENGTFITKAPRVRLWRLPRSLD